MRRWLTGLFLILGLLAAGGERDVSKAADWSMVPSVQMRTEYDSNLNFSFQNRVNDFILTLIPSADFNYTTEIGQVQGHLRFKGLHYLSNGNLDRIDQNFQINGRYAPSPRLNLTLATAYIRDSTLQQELTVSGFVMGRTTRESIMVRPGATYSLSERCLATLNYSFGHVHYQDPQFRDYTGHRLSLSVNFFLRNEKTSLTGVFLGREVQYPDNDFYRSLGTYAGVEHRFSETWSAALLGGLNISRLSFATKVVDSTSFPFFILVKQPRQTTDSVTPFLEAKTTKRWSKASLTGSLRRDQSPSAAGTIFEVTRVYLGFDYKFSERLTGNLSGDFYYNDASSESSRSRNVVFRLSPQITFKITEKLFFNSAYRFYWREDRIADVSAPRHVVWVSLTFSHPWHSQR